MVFQTTSPNARQIACIWWQGGRAGAGVTQQHPRAARGARPGTALPAVPWHSPATNTRSIPACSEEMPGLPPLLAARLRVAVPLRGCQQLAGVGDLGPAQAVTFSGPLACSQVIFQPESPWPKINSAIFTVASLYFSFGIPDAYVPTWAETCFVKFIWVLQYYQPSSASLQRAIPACLSQPEQSCLVVCTWEGWNRLSTKHKLSRPGPLNLFGRC